MQKKRKLLYIYRYCNMGGVASVIKQRFCRMSDQVELCCAFLRDSGTGANEWQKQGIEAHIFGNSFPSKLRQLISNYAFDIVTVFDTPEVMPILNDCYNGPIIYEVHSPKLENMKTGQELYDLGQNIVVPSNWSKKMLIKHFECTSNQVFVIPNFIDESLFQFHPQPLPVNSKKQVLWVGKFGEYKNWKGALDIFEKLCKLDPDVRIVMMTGGGQQQEIQIEYIGEMVQRDLLAHVDINHHVPYGDMHKFYCAAAQSAGVLLSTSLSESFCMVVHEAWRCHLPVVVSEVGPLKETVIDGVNGMKFATNDVDTAVQKIRQVLNSPQLHAKLVQGGLETTCQFDADRHMPQYIALINELIARHTTKALS